MYNKQYWNNLIGEQWTQLLKDLLKSEYGPKLANFLALEIVFNGILPNSIEQIFKNLKDCPYDNLKLIIMTNEPLELGDYSKIKECLEKEYHKGLNIHFDDSFDYLRSQGVLFLSRSLTFKVGEPDKYKKQWKKFFGTLLFQIIKEKPNSIFLMLGEETEKYAELLSPASHIFYWEHPNTARKEWRYWECPNFKQIDKLLTQLKAEKINW